MKFTADVLVVVDDAISIGISAENEQGEVRGFNTEEVDSIAQQLPLFKKVIERILQPQKIEFYFTDDEIDGRQWLLMTITTNTSEAREKIERLLSAVRGRPLTELALSAETQARIANPVRDAQR